MEGRVAARAAHPDGPVGVAVGRHQVHDVAVEAIGLGEGDDVARGQVEAGDAAVGAQPQRAVSGLDPVDHVGRQAVGDAQAIGLVGGRDVPAGPGADGRQPQRARVGRALGDVPDDRCGEITADARPAERILAGEEPVEAAIGPDPDAFAAVGVDHVYGRVGEPVPAALALAERAPLSVLPQPHPVRGRDPQASVAVHEVPNRQAGRDLQRGTEGLVEEVGRLHPARLRPEAPQASPLAAEPQPAPLRRGDAPDRALVEVRSGQVALDGAVRAAPEQAAVGRHPDVAAERRQAVDASVSQALGCGHRVEAGLRRGPAVEPLLRPDPDAALPVLEQRHHVAPDQPGLGPHSQHRVASRQVELEPGL